MLTRIQSNWWKYKLWKFRSFLFKLESHFPRDSASPLLIFTQKMWKHKRSTQRHVSRCSQDLYLQWPKTGHNPHAYIYIFIQWNAAIKRRVLLIHAATYMNLQSITFSGSSQPQRRYAVWFLNFLRRQNLKTEIRSVVAGGCGWDKRTHCRESGGNFHGLWTGLLSLLISSYTSRHICQNLPQFLWRILTSIKQKDGGWGRESCSVC